MKAALKTLVVTLLLGASLAVGGCSYAGVGTTADGRAVVARNDMILFGLLRKVYVCQVTPAGLAACSDSENP